LYRSHVVAGPHGLEPSGASENGNAVFEMTGSRIVVRVLWESVVQHAGQEDKTTMKRHRHTPEQSVRKVREGERLLNEGKDITEVVRHLEIAESTWNRWRAQYGGMKADEAQRLRQLDAENARVKKLLAAQRRLVESWVSTAPPNV
jgi:hypothetical protein